MSRVAGTPGYLDPEYYRTFKATTKSDVFSYGVVLLELITGRPSTFHDTAHKEHTEDDPSVVSLSEWALTKYKDLESDEEKLLQEFVDPRLQGEYSPEAMRRLIDLAANCVRLMGKNRPDMGDVVRRLQDTQDLVLGRNPSQGADVSIREEEAAVYGHMPMPAAWLLGSQGNSSTIGSGTMDSSPASFGAGDTKKIES